MGENVPMSVAVVIGAGIAGLSAAAALAPRYGQVVLLDRDSLPDSATPRRGVPQGYHPHALLAAGQRALEELLPGLGAELVEAGAIPFDPGSDLGFYRYGARWARTTSGLEIVALTRPLLELKIRQRVAALPNVTLRPDTAVAGLTGSAGSAGGDGRVTGVVLDDGTEVAADLVVDSSGRGSRSDRWLGALGLPTPPVAEVRIGVGYATQVLRRDPDDVAEGVGVLVMPTPPGQKRAGLALAVEDDRWLVFLGGWHGEHAPTDPAGFRRYAETLPDPAIAGILARAQPVTDVTTFGFPSSRRRQFERLPAPPAGYLATGDAMCCFNPVYGQGMTCAAMEAVVLGRLLDRYGEASGPMAREYYREAARVLAVPWRFAVGADFAYPETVGPRPRGMGLLNRYATRLQRTAQRDPVVRRTFTAVQQLVRPPGALFAPGIVVRVMKGGPR
jgi:2-polyprenyl-6-methoxyphenol hydroxylase-like FAD-dependent oxidoreductase